MPNSVWYLSFSKKKIEFKKYSVKQKNKKLVKKTKQKSSGIKKFLLGLMFATSLILFSNLISAAAINDSLHINLQTTFANGSIEEGTFVFGFNITESSSASCLGPVVYNHSEQKATDSRGIISIYLPTVGSGGGNLSSLDFDRQYYLCYYRDSTLKDVSQLGRVPYSFRATQVNLSEISVDSNLNMSDFNITDVDTGFFDFLGSLVTRITKIFATDADISNNLDVGGNLTVDSGTLFVNSNLNRVGIGTTTPTRELEILGDSTEIRAESTGFGNQVLIELFGRDSSNSFDEWGIRAGGKSSQSFGILAAIGGSTFERLTILEGGNVGINTTTPQNKLNVVGDANITGTIYQNENAVATIGDCPSGQFVQNTTTGGVECATPSGSGDITGVFTTLDEYLFNGSASGDVYLRFNDTLAGTNLSVNSSDFWDGFNTPNDFSTITASGLITGGEFSGPLNWTFLQNYPTGCGTGQAVQVINDTLTCVNITDAETLDGFDSTFFMPLNTSVYGNFDFNGGWQQGGFSIVGGDIFAQTGFFFTISSLNVTNLEVNGSLIPQLDNQFDIGNATFRWRDLSLGGEISSDGTGDNYFMGNVGINTTTPQNTLNVVGDLNVTGTIYGSEGNITDTYVPYTGAFKNVVLGANNFTVNTNTFFVDSSTGRVGIGTTTPSSQAKLHVVGDIRINTGNSFEIGGNNVGITDGDSGNSLHYFGQSSQRFYLDTNNNAVDTFEIYGDVLEGNTTGALFIVQDTGEVGIGTTTPQEKLHVAGNAVINGTLNLDSNKIISLANGTAAQDAVTLSQLQQVNGTGNLTGGGTTNTVAKFTSAGVLGDSLITDDGTIVAVDTSDLYINTSSGNVGINTTSPQNLLNVVGDLNVTGTIYGAEGNITDTYVPYTGAFKNVDLGANNFSVGTSDFFVNSNDDKVGIGTATPDRLLTVLGALDTGANNNFNNVLFQVRDSSGNQRIGFRLKGNVAGILTGDNFPNQIISQGANPLEIFTLSSQPLVFGTNTFSRMIIIGTGNVGIGTTTPQEKLHVAGNALINGTLNLDSNKIISLANGTAAQDAVTLSQLQQVNGTGNLTGGGTTNTVAKFTSAGVLGDSLITDDGTIVAIDTSDLYVNTTSGNVGINTTTPTNLLEVSGGRTLLNTIFLGEAITGKSRIETASGRDLQFRISGAGGDDFEFVNPSSTLLFINGTNGNVGIGTTSPTSKLELSDSNYLQLEINQTDSGAIAMGITSGTADSFFNALSGPGGSAELKFLIDSSEKVRIDNSGNVGIGTTSPGAKLDVNVSSGLNTIFRGSNVQIMLHNTAGSTDLKRFGFQSLSNQLHIQKQADAGTPTTSLMTIDGDGNVGINTTTPQNLLNVLGDGNITGTLYVGSCVGCPAGGGGGNSSAWNRSGTDVFLANTGDNVGIGTTTPSNILDVVNSTGSARISITGASSEQSAIEFNNGTGDETSVIYRPVNSNDLRIWGSILANDIITFNTTSGNVGIGTTSPAKKLDVVGDLFVGSGATGRIYLGDQTSKNDYIENIDDGTGFKFIIDTNERVRIQNNGNVGIGTTSPGSQLEINGSGASQLRLTGSGSTNTAIFFNPGGTFSDMRFTTSDGSDNKIFRVGGGGDVLTTRGAVLELQGNEASGAGDAIIRAGDASGSTIQLLNGNVGIGTTSPGAKLHVQAGDVNISASAAEGYPDLILSGQGTAVNLRNDGARLWMHSNGATNMRVNVATDYSNDLGLNLLYTPGTIGAFGGVFQIGQDTKNSATFTHGITTFLTNGTEKMRIDASGNVGIGTTSPETKLHIIGSGSYAGLGDTALVVQPTSNNRDIGISLNTTRGLGHVWQIRAGTGEAAVSENLRFYSVTNGNDVMVITNTSRVGIGTTSPSNRLEVNGSLETSDLLDLDASNFFDGGCSADQYISGISSTGAISCAGDSGTGTMSSFLLAGTSGSAQTITQGNTALIEAGTAITTTGAATDKVTVAVTNDAIGDTQLAFNTGQALTTASSPTFSNVLWGGSASRTNTKDNASAIASKSGFFETAAPVNYYSGASSWQHLIEARHSNDANNYALQIAGSFFDQDLYFRKINNNVATAWNKFIYQNSAGNVGIGTTTPTGGKLNIVGGNLNMSGNNIISVNKLTADEIDPVYTINNVSYATYVASIAGGLKEEVTGTVRLNSSYTIDFKNLGIGSDLWLFYQITDFGENMEKLQIILTPSFNGNVWYEKNPLENTLTIHGESSGEVSYRFTANRFDWRNRNNLVEGDSTGMIVPMK